MTSRFVPLLLAAAVAGCGGDGDEDAIRSSLEQFGATDEPRACDVRTARFLRNTMDEDDAGAALRLCRRRKGSIVELSGGRSAGASDIAVEGDRATAQVRQGGGDFDGQDFRATLVKENETWKLDRLDGIRIGDALRTKIDGQLGSYLEQGLRDNVPPQRLRSTVACAIARTRRLVSNERLAAAAGGHPVARALSDDIEEAATGCLADREYGVAAPSGWRDITKQAGGARFDLVLKSARGTVTVIKDADPAAGALEAYYEGVRAKSAARLPRAPEPARLGGVAAFTYEFLDRTPKGEPLSTRQVLALRRGIAYFVSFGADPKDFARTAKDFDAVLASWRWK